MPVKGSSRLDSGVGKTTKNSKVLLGIAGTQLVRPEGHRESELTIPRQTFDTTSGKGTSYCLQAECQTQGLGQRQELADTYLDLQMKMHNLYLPDLQRIERLCTRLHLLHPDNAVVQKLREMLVKHIRPLIALVKAPKPNITEGQMNYLLKMSRVLPPFLKDLDHSVQELRKSNTRATLHALTKVRLTAAAA